MKETSELWKLHCEVEDKFTNLLKDFRKEVNMVQEMAKDLAQKIMKSGYTFQKKGHDSNAISTLEFRSPLLRLIASWRSWHLISRTRMP